MELIDKQKIFEKLKHTMPECGEDNSKERYRYMQWLADNNAIKELPTVKAILLERVEQILSEIQSLRGCSCSCSDGIIDDVEDIIDKAIKELNE